MISATATHPPAIDPVPALTGRYAGGMATTDRTLLRAEILSIGSELTVGDTRDTNSAELARSLTSAGVAVSRITTLPDRFAVVAEAFLHERSRAFDERRRRCSRPIRCGPGDR